MAHHVRENRKMIFPSVVTFSGKVSAVRVRWKQGLFVCGDGCGTCVSLDRAYVSFAVAAPPQKIISASVHFYGSFRRRVAGRPDCAS